MIWFHRTLGVRADIMRDAATSADVSWNFQPIKYKNQKVGYVNGDASDASIIQDELESILGYRPMLTSEPVINSKKPFE
jgi:hypothetical protein